MKVRDEVMRMARRAGEAGLSGLSGVSVLFSGLDNGTDETDGIDQTNHPSSQDICGSVGGVRSDSY